GSGSIASSSSSSPSRTTNQPSTVLPKFLLTQASFRRTPEGLSSLHTGGICWAMLVAVSGGAKKRDSGDDPPYARYAFLNPYNLSLLVGATATAAATGHWWIALCAGATEA